MGVANAELWNNVGLCCFYASQYDITLSCFDKALQLADDSTLPDIWYNIGQVRSGVVPLFEVSEAGLPTTSEALWAVLKMLHNLPSVRLHAVCLQGVHITLPC